MGCNPENTGQKDMKSLQNKRRTAYALIDSNASSGSLFCCILLTNSVVLAIMKLIFF